MEGVSFWAHFAETSGQRPVSFLFASPIRRHGPVLDRLWNKSEAGEIAPTRVRFAAPTVLDVYEIVHVGGTIWWCVPDLIEYFDLGNIILAQDDKKWAINNQKYVVWRFFTAESVLHWSS